MRRSVALESVSKEQDRFRMKMYNKMVDDHVEFRKYNRKSIYLHPIEMPSRDSLFNPTIATLRAFWRTTDKKNLVLSKYPES